MDNKNGFNKIETIDISQNEKNRSNITQQNEKNRSNITQQNEKNRSNITPKVKNTTNVSYKYTPVLIFSYSFSSSEGSPTPPKKTHRLLNIAKYSAVSNETTLS
jgi:hypothetical protein